MDGVFEFLKAHYQYVLIAGGLLFLIGAIRDWQWEAFTNNHTTPIDGNSENAKKWLETMFGR